MSSIGYSASDLQMDTNGVPLDGLADGDFFSYEDSKETVDMQVGSGGEVALSFVTDTSGTATFTAMRGSPVNARLQALYDARASFTLSVQDKYGAFSFFCGDAVIAKRPPLSLGGTNGNLEWMIKCPHVRLTYGTADRI